MRSWRTPGEKDNHLMRTKDKSPFGVGAYFYFLKTILIFTSVGFKVVFFALAFGSFSLINISCLLETWASSTLEPKDCLRGWICSDVSIRAVGHQTFLWIQGAWMPGLVRLNPSLCWNATAGSWCHVRIQSPCQGWYMRYRHWQIWPHGQPRERWQLALITHMQTMGVGGVTSDAVPGGRQSKSEMTPVEWENWLTYFPPFLLLQPGDKLGHFVVFQEEIFELPTQASEGDLSSSLDKYDYEHIRGSRLWLQLVAAGRSAEWGTESCFAIYRALCLCPRACVMAVASFLNKSDTSLERSQTRLDVANRAQRLQCWQASSWVLVCENHSKRTHSTLWL